MRLAACRSRNDQATARGLSKVPILHTAFRTSVVRLQKFLADSGVASRRSGERIILAGRVTVNGEVVRELGTKVQPGIDVVTVDGTPLRPRRRLYVALNKPPGYLCTQHDPEKRRIIGELLPREW